MKTYLELEAEIEALKAENEELQETVEFYQDRDNAYSATEIQTVLMPYLLAIKNSEQKDKRIAVLEQRLQIEQKKFEIACRIYGKLTPGEIRRKDYAFEQKATAEIAAEKIELLEERE